MKNELTQRVKNIQQFILASNADACIITTAVNQYYLCNFVFDGYLYILPQCNPILFVRRPQDIDADNVIYIRKPEQIAEILEQKNIALPKSVLIESDVMPFSVAQRLQASLLMPKLMNVSGEMRRIRSLKSESELNQMRECAKIQAEVYRQIPSLYRRGMSDIEFQAEVEYLMRRSGSIGIFRAFGNNMDIFMGSVLAGDNAQAASPFDFSLGGKGLSPLLPIGASGHALREGNTIMFDMAGNYGAYQTDMSRTFAIGSVSDLARKAHQTSIDIHNAIIRTAKAGISCASLFFIAEEIVKTAGLESYFMGTAQQAKFIGHGLGLEINEPPVLTPRSKEILQSGMAIAVEPKFTLPEIGAVGIENTYIVHETELEKITICEEEMITLDY